MITATRNGSQTTVPAQPPTHQTLSAGTLPAERAALLPWTFGDVRTPEDPIAGAMAIVKRSGAGGSYFVQSIPNSVILNTDLTTVVHRPLRASIWPLVVNGVCLEPNPAAPGDISKANTINVTWKNVVEKVDYLVKLAERGAPRPKVVSLDTLDSTLLLIQSWIANQSGVACFADLDLRAWNQAYSQFWDRLFWPLRKAGYSVVIVVQLFDEPVRVKDPVQGFTTVIRENSPLVSDKFFKHIAIQCSTVGLIEIYEGTAGQVVLENGKPTYKPGPLQKRRRMVFYGRNLGDIVKKRAELPDEIDITGPDPYLAFENAWKKAYEVSP